MSTVGIIDECIYLANTFDEVSKSGFATDNMASLGKLKPDPEVLLRFPSHFQSRWVRIDRSLDLRIVTEEAQHLGLTLPSSAAAEKVFEMLVERGLGEEDSVAVLKLIESRS